MIEMTPKLETLSYLPALDADRIRAQLEYLLERGWIAAIEHIEPERAGESYWYMWRLPMFGVTDVGAVMSELEACRDAYPGHHVRLLGYDSNRQTQGLSLVAFRAG